MPDRGNVTPIPAYRSRLTARPTVYKGILMRSRLEATFAAMMDENEAAWAYEPKCFADETGQYLPDFSEWDPDHPELQHSYIEVKPFAPPGPETDAIKRRMEIIWSSEPIAALTIWTPTYSWFGNPRYWEPPSDVDGTWELWDE